MNSLGTRLASPWMLLQVTESWAGLGNEAGNWISDTTSPIGWETCRHFSCALTKPWQIGTKIIYGMIIVSPKGLHQYSDLYPDKSDVS